MGPKHDWQALREHFLLRNLDPDESAPYTLTQMAKDKGIPYQSLKERASQEHWRAELKERARQQSEAVVDRTQKQFITEEVATREQHRQLAKYLQALATKCLQDAAAAETINASMPPTKAAELLMKAMEAERKAMGLNDRVDVQLFAPATDEENEYASPEEKKARKEYRASALNSILDALGKKPDSSEDPEDDDSPEATAPDAAVH